MHNKKKIIVSIKSDIPDIRADFEGKNILYEKMVEVKTTPQRGSDGTEIFSMIFLYPSNFKNKPHAAAV